MSAAPGRRERKVVTVVFADLVGFTSRAESLDPEDVEAILRPYHARLRGELERYGGTVEKFIGDAVMAVFGAPVAHEDDAERAVRAALAIRDWARDEDGVDVRIGVNTGEALVSLDARPDAGEGMVAGDVVNTAFRIQSAAPVNGVLAGEATERATRSVVVYRAADAVDAKGKHDPVAVWEAVEARARATVEQVGEGAPLVGRDAELGALVAALDRARTRREPQLVTLVGVPGIGKSRLVAELYRAIDAEPELIRWRRGRSLPYGESTPLAAFAEMVRAHVGILDSDTPEEAEAKLLAGVEPLGPDGDELAERLRPLVGLGGAAVGTADARAQSFAAWRRWVEAFAEQGPVVLVFDDLHWGDDDLLDFVDHLVDWVTDAPLLVVTSTRPELLDRRPGWGGGKRNAQTIWLAPLGDSETAELIARLVGRAVLPAELQSDLLVRAGGNPLYAEQYAAMLAEGGDTAGVPATVQGIIASRLDALSPSDKELVQAAAVVGRQFWVGAVAELTGEPRATVDERLHALQRKDFVRRERRSSIAGETEIAFAHVLVRDVAYGQLARGGRMVLHRAAAAWLEGLAVGRSDDRADMLAHHYVVALELGRAAGAAVDDLVEPARRALADAGDRALAVGAFASARRLYERALELWPDGDLGRAELVARHADAVFNSLAQPDRELLAETAEVLAASGATAQAAKLEVIAAIAAWWEREGDAAEAHAQRAMELVRNEPPSPEKAIVLSERARLLMVGARDREAIVVGTEGLTMAQELGLDTVAASALVTVGTARYSGAREAGDLERGARELEQAIAIGERVHAAQQVQRGYINLAEFRNHHGHVQEALALVRAARRFAEEFGDPYGTHWLDTAECWIAFHAGDWLDAERRADAFLARLEGGMQYYTESVARDVRAEVRLGRGDLRGAVDEAELGLAASRPVGDPQAVGPSLVTLARVRLEEGRTAEARALLDELLALGTHGFAHWEWIVDSAWLARRLGRVDAWQARAAEQYPSALVEIGRAAVRGDEVATAEALEAKGYRTDAAYASLRAAEDLAPSGRRAEAEVAAARAVAFFHGVGATALAARCEALLAATA